MTTPSTPKRLSLRAAGVALAIAAVGVVGYQAVAQTKPAQHAAIAVKHGGWGGGRSAMTPEEMEKQIDRMVAHAAIEIDATDEQSAEIAAIAKAAAKEIRPLRDAMREDARKLQSLLLAEVVNPSEIEALRAARLADFDAKSKIVADAVAKIATILTPEQRRLAEERIERFRSHRGGWRH